VIVIEGYLVIFGYFKKKIINRIKFLPSLFLFLTMQYPSRLRLNLLQKLFNDNEIKIAKGAYVYTSNCAAVTIDISFN
jgi:hypothetical protein